MSEINMYVCGPTVYNHSHIGHGRTYVSFDIIKRILTHLNFNVNYVINITDIDDKIINSNADVKLFENEFWNDMNHLNVQQPNHITRVSEYIDKIILFIQKIIENGFAYEENGSVYFNTIKYMENGFKYDIFGRDVNCCEINDDINFVLWKKCDIDGFSFSSPWGNGRPGWHIECSCMAVDIFDGKKLDIHGGGIDLCFPHHQNEVAQVNAYFNTEYEWVKKFIHVGHLHIDGLKMSKSLKNFITIKDMFNKYDMNEIRLLFLLTNFEKPMHYSEETMIEIVKKNIMMATFLNSPININNSEDEDKIINDLENEFNNYLNDLNHEDIMNKLFLFIKTKNISENKKKFVQKYIDLFGLNYTLKDIKPELNELINIRNFIRNKAMQLKDNQLFKESDRIRKYLVDNFKIYIVDIGENTYRIL